MRSQLSYFMWAPVFFLVLLGYFSIMPSIDAQGSTDCNRQTSSPVDCPTSAESDEESANDDNDAGGNIEDRIPSVLPFP